MSTQRYVRLFRNGVNQAIRIPREFELPGTEAILTQEGNRLILEALPPPRLVNVLASLQNLPELVEFP